MPTAPTVSPAEPAPLLSLAATQRFDARKRHHRPVATPLMQDHGTRGMGQDIDHCAERLQVLLQLPEGADPSLMLTGYHPCRRRLCPTCGWRSSMVWRARLLDGLEKFFTEHPKHTAVFLTLTVRNVPLDRMAEGIKDLHRSWQRLAKMSQFPTGFWLRKTEITVGRPAFQDDLPTAPRTAASSSSDPALFLPESLPGAASGSCRNSSRSPSALLDPASGGQVWVHPHLHVLLLVPPSYWSHGYVRKTTWQQWWAMAARLDYQPVIDVRRATAKGQGATAFGEAFDATIEASKYITKHSDLQHLGPALPEFARQIAGHRLMAVSGGLRPFVPANDPSAAELADERLQGRLAAHPSLPCIAQWDRDVSHYRLRPQA